LRWQEFLNEKLELCNEQKQKIIIDKFFFSKENLFTIYLNQKNISYSVASDINSLLITLKDNNNIFFTGNYAEIPDSVKKYREIITLDDNLCLCKISKQLLRTLSNEDIRKILIYAIDTRDIQLLNESNLNEKFKKADKHYKIQRIEFLTNKIRNLETGKSIFEIAQDYANIIIDCYTIDREIELEFLNFIDNIIYNFIITDEYKNAFYSNDKTINRIVHLIKKNHNNKFALICFDGMGILEWEILKKFFLANGIKINSEQLMFSLIPTNTAICRAALFSGKLEECYEKHLNETKEFKNFFKEYKCSSYSVGGILNNDIILDENAIKIIYNFFDDIAHGQTIPFSKSNKYNYFIAIENYLNKGSILQEIKKLIECGYKIYITSDHGSVVSKGNGLKFEKYIIESKCKRAIIADNNKLIEKYKDSVLMINPPFISNKKVLVAKNREFFGPNGAVEITHGGISIEEIIIPFVEVN